MSHSMDAKQLLDLVTEEDIINILLELGSDHIKDSDGSLRFYTVCHGGSSRKLYYYPESRNFHCYTSCGSMSLYDLLMHIYGWEFGVAYGYVLKYKQIDTTINRAKGFSKSKKTCSDFDFLQKYKRYGKIKEQYQQEKNGDIFKLPELNKTILNRFDNVYPESWLNENITESAMWKFGIKFYSLQFKVVIPHYDMYGRLVGIRGRSYLKYDILEGKKYMPIYYGKEVYKHPLHFNLFGLYQNLDAIKKTKKVMLVEAEKSVLQCESYYPNNNFSVALCGSTLSKYQRDLILSLDVDEVFIALDKQYQTTIEDEKDKLEYERYLTKVYKIADSFLNYVNVYIIYCDDDRLEYKDSPTDRGKETLEALMKEKYRYTGREQAQRLKEEERK